MKTKNLFLTALFVATGILCVNSAKADGTTTPGNPTDQVTVNIKLYPIHTLIVTNGQKPVDLEYKTVTDYDNGVIKPLVDHITVYSTGGFTISVKSNQAFTRTGGETISSDDVAIIAGDGTKGTGIEDYSALQYLSTTEGKTIISSDAGGKDLKYNITYNNQKGKDLAYIDKYIKGENPTVYTADITYTIAAK